MKTEILCPNCMKKILTILDQEAECENCKAEFVVIGKTTVKFKNRNYE